MNKGCVGMRAWGEMQVDEDVAGTHVQELGHVFEGCEASTMAGMH